MSKRDEARPRSPPTASSSASLSFAASRAFAAVAAASSRFELRHALLEGLDQRRAALDRQNARVDVRQLEEHARRLFFRSGRLGRRRLGLGT